MLLPDALYATTTPSLEFQLSAGTATSQFQRVYLSRNDLHEAERMTQSDLSGNSSQTVPLQIHDIISH